MNNPLISIIVPIYKVEHYLKRCVDSIIQQTYTNLEIILVDDGSPDKCPEICDSFKNSDSRIVVIHKANGGLSDARNAGMSIYKGEYLCFVDSDDYVDPSYVERLYFSLKSSNADLAVCEFEQVDDDDNVLKVNESIIKNEILTKYDYFKKMENNHGYHYKVAWNKLYSKKAVGNVLFPFGKIHEDEATIHRFVNNCERIVTLNDKLYFYSIRNNSIMRNSSDIKRMDYIDAMYDRISLYISIGYTKTIDNLVRWLVLYYYSKRQKIRKGNECKIKELDKLIENCVNICWPYIYSLKTKITILFPKLCGFLMRIINR